jgi:hypothetical protein
MKRHSNEMMSAHRSMKRLVDFLRMPGATGVAIAVVSVPLILLMPEPGILIALVALCLYPVLDVPRILARSSWWRGAMISALVWIVLFTALVGTVDSVRPLREDAMVFLLPFMMYPMALAISGLVRLEGRVRGRPRESGPRIAGILGAVACGLLVGVPLTLNMIPALMQGITGDSPPNFEYSSEGEVLSVTPEHITVRLTTAATESFRLSPETKFVFQGPGSPMVTGPPAGPVWLTPGQRIGLHYVYRAREAQAHLVTIWIDRKGCAGDAKWTAARQTPAPSSHTIPSLIGTTWESWVGSPDVPSPHEITTLEFVDDTRLAYQRLADGGARYTDGLWRQNGTAVLIELNDCYALYEGRIEGDEIKGDFSNEIGARASWIARRKRP